MKHLILLGLLALAQAQTLSDTTTTAANFCNMSVCKPPDSSVACSFTKSTNVLCEDGKVLTFDKYAVVKKHNDLRQLIASGNLPGYLAAQRMAEMKYSDELAQMALYNVKQCQFAHDTCRATTNYPYAGQNIGIYSRGTFGVSKIDESKIDESISLIIDDWFNQNLKCNMGEINKLNDLIDCGSFTQIVQEKSAQVGCAASTFFYNNVKILYFVCNYSVGNLNPSYIAGKATGKCTARSAYYNALCSKY